MQEAENSVSGDCYGPVASSMRLTKSSSDFQSADTGPDLCSRYKHYDYTFME